MTFKDSIFRRKTMRYFRIYADKKNIQPNFPGWNQFIRPGIRQGSRIYEELEKRNYFKVELNREIQFMDIISSPCFMVSRELADLVRLYCPGIQFKYMVLFDEKNRRMTRYQVPRLEEIDCMEEGSEWEQPGGRRINIVLRKSRISGQSVFRLKGLEEEHIAASLEFIESALRREVRGMGIEEYEVR